MNVNEALPIILRALGALSLVRQSPALGDLKADDSPSQK